MAIMREFGWDWYTYLIQPRVTIAKIQTLMVAERLDALEAHEEAERKAKRNRGGLIETRYNPQRKPNE